MSVRVVEGSCLENRRAQWLRRFESCLIRHDPVIIETADRLLADWVQYPFKRDRSPGELHVVLRGIYSFSVVKNSCNWERL